MRAVDTKVLVRFLVADDPAQARKVKRLFEQAEESGERFLVTTPVVLELVWVLSSVYDLSRAEVLEAVELLTQLPILEFEADQAVRRLVRLGGSGTADLADLLIGLVGEAAGSETTLTFEKRLVRTGLFQHL